VKDELEELRTRRELENINAEDDEEVDEVELEVSKLRRGG